MKGISILIIFDIFLFKYILCIENIDQIFNNTYSKLSEITDENTIYYSRNTKYSNFNSNSGICLIGKHLYKFEGENNHQLLTDISDYKSYFYYELNLYKDENTNNTKCFIIYFKNQSELIFKYYQIDIVNNKININEDLIYYNTSMNPLNRGISCHNNDTNNLFNCFYINENKEVIQMNINLNIANIL